MFCLTVPTDEAWAREAARDLDAVLVDHAHCEMKAASHALSLVVRHPGDLDLVRALTDLAREELDHFGRVVDFLAKRGLSLGAPPVDEYAAALRRAMGALPPSPMPAVVDRLLASALIEARSCERFKLLLQVLPPSCPSDLRAFYEELFACEARHYRMYVDLATRAAGEDVTERLTILAEREGAIVKALAGRDARATVHG
ncbi:MAG TPA: tRNA isopentenyl-2-thiomethyl-A-37 hydroxylase MiaE [Labilithrix sp.]|jgi:tRNA-(ms[2]io[6]A)-hydroxylase